MKKIIVGLSFTLITGFCFSQSCERNGDFSGGTVSGGAKLKIAKNGKMFIQFNGNFKTTEGPDLNIYLSNTSTVNEDSKLIHGLEALEASQKYKLVDPVGIDDYKYVVIHCTKYNHHFGTALLNPKTGEGCIVED